MSKGKEFPPKEKPRARFCWHCSRKLCGKHVAFDKTPDGHEVAVHVGCKKAKGDQYDIISNYIEVR